MAAITLPGDRRDDLVAATAADLTGAVGAALALAAPENPILLLYEKLGPVRALLAKLGVKPLTARSAARA